MLFLKELRRYWFINLRDYKKSVIPMAFNIGVIFLFYLFLKKDMSYTYIVSYSIIWLLLTSQLGMLQDFSSDMKSRRIKYFFNGDRNLTSIYLSRYIISCTKYSILFYLFFKIIQLTNVIQYNLKFIDVILLCIGLYSFFFINYILTLMTVLNKKMQVAFNFLRCLILYFLIMSNSKILPLSYAVRQLGDNCFANTHFTMNDGFIIVLNSMIYCILGYFICLLLTKYLKYKILE